MDPYFNANASAGPLAWDFHSAQVVLQNTCQCAIPAKLPIATPFVVRLWLILQISSS